MDYRDPNSTVSVKPCSACGFGLLENDRFCRQCGSKQVEATIPAVFIDPEGLPPATRSGQLDRPPHSYQTTLISGHDTEERLYGSISGPLVSAIVRSLSSTAPVGFCGRVVRKAFSTLISIIIWLMMVLLSPIDAYLAPRSVWARSQCEENPGSNAGRKEISEGRELFVDKESGSGYSSTPNSRTLKE
jgi:hypothetical protein